MVGIIICMRASSNLQRIVYYNYHVYRAYLRGWLNAYEYPSFTACTHAHTYVDVGTICISLSYVELFGYKAWQ